MTLKIGLLSLGFTLFCAGLSADVCKVTENVVETVERCIPGTKVKATSSAFPDGKRKYYEVSFPQPVDHKDPSLGTFTQKLVLAHRSYDEPMVLQTSGYSIFSVAPSMIAVKYDTNQIQVEHRFFKNSIPASLDWSKLDIEQSAADFHRITVSFKQLYGRRWVNTGASKGGMTSVYHRYYYPEDLDGTVADVAPLSFSNEDMRYVEFIDAVGGDKYRLCRQKLEDLQTHMLKNRAAFESKIEGKFDFLGGKSLAFEHGVLELTFYYWQYHSPLDPITGCDALPLPIDSDEKILKFFNAINPLNRNYGDEGLAEFLPYFYQAASELGAPTLKRSHLAELLNFTYSVDQYTPKGVHYTYANDQMIEVGEWVRENGVRMMFAYGELDPWSAGRFPEKVSDDCHWYTVPGENHRATIFRLPAAEKKEAMGVLSKWIGKVPTAERMNLEETLETLEFAARRGHP